MSQLRDKCAIVGTGKSRLGRLSSVRALGLLEDVIKNALNEAGLTNKAIDGLICRSPDDICAHHQMMVQHCAEISLLSGHGSDYVCHSTLILGKVWNGRI